MKLIKLIITITLPLPVLACSTGNLHQANSALSNSYDTLLAQEAHCKNTRTPPCDLFVLQGAKDALADLAKDTAAQAKKARDIAIKIALYRVSATAAWQAELDNAVSYTNEGVKACAENFSEVVNHCGMLTIIPNLILVDKITLEATPVLEDIQSSAGDMATLGQQAQGFFDAYVDRANTTIADYKKLKANHVASTLLEGFALQSATLFNDHLGNVNAAILRAKPDSYQRNRCTRYKTLSNAEAAGIKVKQISKPRGCTPS